MLKRHDWTLFYHALVEFGSINGHCNVPLRYQRIQINEADSIQLGAWLAAQRREYLNGKLKPDRLEPLQKLVDKGLLCWAPLNHSKQSEHTWPFMFECLQHYCREQSQKLGGTPVKSVPEVLKWKHPTGIEVGLGRWMHTQNKQRRSQKLRADRLGVIQELVKEGVFIWPSSRGGNSIKSNAEEEMQYGSLAGVKTRRVGTKRWRGEASLAANDVQEKVSMHPPLATMPYVRDVAAKYFTAAADFSAEGVRFDVIHPLPNFKMSSADNPELERRTGELQSSSQLTITRTEPIPQVIQVDIPRENVGVTHAVKIQLESQLIAHLCMKMRGRLDSTTFYKRAAAALAKLSS